MDKEKWVERLTKHATDTTYYKVYCEYCDNDSGEEEYASSAAEEAYEQGFRVIKVPNRDYENVICGSCLAKKAAEKEA
jgi:hypothetical protein